MKTDFILKQNSYRDLIDKNLAELISPKNESYLIVKEAMRYSLLAGGKRIRPILTLEFCKVFGGDINKAIGFACAVEMVHCYSLIHDDLPCMDNDDIRRGKPSCHKQFGEANALLAGDSLITLSFNTIANSNKRYGTAMLACLEATISLSNFSGVDGMIGGQVVDLLNEGKKIDGKILHEIHTLKTSALICAAIDLGVLASGNFERQNAISYGRELGLAFQMVDDILDVIGNEKDLGKPIGSDEVNEKTTYVTLYGLDYAKKLAEEHTQNAINLLSNIPNNGFLMELTHELLTRIN